MERTAEEFVHQLPSGRWFVGDFVGRRHGQDVFLVETLRSRVLELTMDAIEEPASPVPMYAHKSSAKRAAQKMIERVLDEDADGENGSCVCFGLGAYVAWNGSTANPAYEVRACADHPLTADATSTITAAKAAATRIAMCLQAIADVRDILWPGGDPETAWSPDTIEAIGRRLALLAPQGGK